MRFLPKTCAALTLLAAACGARAGGITGASPPAPTFSRARV